MSEPRIDAEFVIYRLEEAGKTLLSLPGGGMPAGIRVAWPAVVQAAAEAYGYTPEQGALGSDEREWRPPVPSAAAIDRMDKAFRWLALIPRIHASPHGGALLARVVLMRSLISPRTERHWWPWRRIADALGCHHDSVKAWHARGIDVIVSGLHGVATSRPIAAGTRCKPRVIRAVEFL